MITPWTSYRRKLAQVTATMAELDRRLTVMELEILSWQTPPWADIDAQHSDLLGST